MSQPWVSIRADRLGELREHFDVVLVDAALPEGLRAQPDDEPTEVTGPVGVAKPVGTADPASAAEQ